MTAMRSVLLTVLVGLCAASVPAATAADPAPPFDGLMAFQNIQGPEEPEEFSWQVKLSEGEELKAIDDQHAGVFWEDETQAMTITAVAAHDSIGTNVRTTLAVTQPNIITLTVHHRAGNPAAGGAPFDYPVVAGAGWEGGFQTSQVVMPPPEVSPTPPSCVVPDLTGRTLRASRRILHSAHCELGQVRGERSRRVRVARQYRLVGRVLPVWTSVDVKTLRVVQGVPTLG